MAEVDSWLASQDAEKLGSRMFCIAGRPVMLEWWQNDVTDFFVSRDGDTWNVYTQLDGVGEAETLADAGPRVGLPPVEDDEFVHPDACEECLHLGWHPSSSDTHGDSIERCDVCQAFGSDDAALAHALRLAAAALRNPKPRAGARFDMVLEAMKLAAERVHKTPCVDE